MEEGKGKEVERPMQSVPVAPEGYFAIHGGKEAGVYTVEAKAEATGRTYKFFDNLEAAMKYYQLGFDGLTFEPTRVGDDEVLWMREEPPALNKKAVHVYIRGAYDKVGITISTENATFVQQGFEEETAWKFYLEAIAFAISTVFGEVGEGLGGLVTPDDFNLSVVVPDKKVLRKLKYPKSPIPMGISAIHKQLREFPVMLLVNEMQCQVHVLLTSEKEEK